jgi:hypothetical protein
MFIKQFANEYSDFELLSKGILDKSSQEKALLAAKDFKANMRECDRALSSNDLNKVLDLYPRTAKDIEEFFSYMQDIPDEI